MHEQRMAIREAHPALGTTHAKERVKSESHNDRNSSNMMGDKPRAKRVTRAIATIADSATAHAPQ